MPTRLSNSLKEIELVNNRNTMYLIKIWPINVVIDGLIITKGPSFGH